MIKLQQQNNISTKKSPIIFKKPSMVVNWIKQNWTIPANQERATILIIGKGLKLLKAVDIYEQPAEHSVVIAPGDIFRAIIREPAATGFFLIHNHPSGNPMASNADIMTTKMLVVIAAFLDLQFYDHLIIGNADKNKQHHVFCFAIEKREWFTKKPHTINQQFQKLLPLVL